jgi:hypothetical protein
LCSNPFVDKSTQFELLYQNKKFSFVLSFSLLKF